MPADPHVILVLGATGYLGRHVTRRLVDSGREVAALVRSIEAEAALPAGVAAIRGDATDPADLRAAVAGEVSAVINLVTPSGDLGVDARATAVLLSTLAERRNRTYLHTSGVWVLGPTQTYVADETAPARPIEIVGYRPAVEEQVLEAAEAGVRTVVIRPGVVHGHGQGIPRLLVDLARSQGHGVWVGDRPAPRWPMVHVDDLADLYLLALADAPAASILHAVAEPGVDVRELAAAAAGAARVGARPVVGWSVAEAARILGEPFAEALACHQVVTASRSRSLGWCPSRSGAVADLASESYAGAAVS